MLQCGEFSCGLDPSGPDEGTSSPTEVDNEGMQFVVPDEVLKETTKCKANFACLRTGGCDGRPMCEIGEAAGHNVLFLEDKDPCPCAYRLPFGFGQICTCPTRYAIFKKYGE